MSSVAFRFRIGGVRPPACLPGPTAGRRSEYRESAHDEEQRDLDASGYRPPTTSPKARRVTRTGRSRGVPDNTRSTALAPWDLRELAHGEIVLLLSGAPLAKAHAEERRRRWAAAREVRLAPHLA